jgi:hypothetical protein
VVGLRSVTVRLNEGEYALLQASAVAKGLSVTSLAKTLVVGGVPMVEPAPNGARMVCLRAARHEPGVWCPLCGAR